MTFGLGLLPGGDAVHEKRDRRIANRHRQIAAYSPFASLRSALDDRERGQRDPKIARSEDEPIRRWSRPSSIGPSADEWCRRSRGRATPYQTRSMLPSREGWTRGSTGDAGPPRRALSCLNAAHFRDDRSTKSPLASHDVFHCAATVAPSAAVGTGPVRTTSAPSLIQRTSSPMPVRHSSQAIERPPSLKSVQ